MPDPVDPAVERQRAEQERQRALVTKVWNHPDIGAAVRKIAKESFPDITLPEDNFAPILAPLKAQNDALAEELKALREDRATEKKEREERAKARTDQAFTASLEEAAVKFRLTDEGKELMRKRMLDTGNYSDPYAAAAYIVSQNPPPAAPGPMHGFGDLNFAGSSTVDPKYELLHRDPGKYFESEVREAFGPNAKGYVARELGQQYADAAFGS